MKKKFRIHKGQKMADIISLEEISNQIESADYSNPASVEELKRLLERADAAYVTSNQYDQFISIRKKYEEKIRNPHDTDSRSDASGTDRRFEEIKGNQERREFLEAKINREGDLILSPSEKAFLAEQIANGNMYDQLQDGEKILKIAKALDGEGYEKTIRENVLKKLDKPDLEMMPADQVYLPNSSHSFGEQILKDLEGAAPKEELAVLQQQVDRLLANVEAYGETQGNMSARRGLINKVRELQETSKGLLKFNYRRKLNNQLKKIDPNYYDTKIVYASALMAPYYRARVALRDRNLKNKNEKTQRLEKKYNNVTVLQDVINQNAFWSRNMGKNISARFKLLGTCLSEFRLSSKGVTNKYAKRLNLTDTSRHIETLDAKLSELKSQKPENPRSRARLKKQIQMYEAQKAAFGKQAEKISGQRKNKIDNIQTQTEPVKQNIRERLEKMAKSLEKERIEAIKSSDRYKALVILQSRGGLSAEQKKELDAMINGLTEKAITAQNVYEKILRENGVTGDELEAKIAELFPPREKDDEANENKDTPVSENDDKGKDEKEDQNQSTLNTVVTHEERRDGEDITPSESGLEVSHPDENTYNISGKGGKDPTAEQCAEFVANLKKDGYESFSLAENVTPEFYENMVKAAKDANLVIENQAELEQKFASRPGREGFGGQENGNSGTSNADKDTETRSPTKVERRENGEILLTRAQLMALNAEGRLEMGGQNRYYDANDKPLTVNGKKGLSFAELSSENRAYLEELGLGEQHIQETLKREAKEKEEYKSLTEAQQQALDAEGRNIMGGTKRSYSELSSQDKAYLEEEGLGQKYTNGVLMGRQIMHEAELSVKDITVEKMDLLMQVQKQNPEQFEEFKKSKAYQDLPAGQKKLVDAVNALANNQSFKSKDEKKQAIVLGRLVGQYKASVEKEKTKKGKQKAKQRFIDQNITRHIRGGKANG